MLYLYFKPPINLLCQNNAWVLLNKDKRFVIMIVKAKPFFQDTDFVIVGTQIQVFCKTGYAIDSSLKSQISICNEFGVWNPPIATCQTIQCDPPPEIPGMIIIGNGYRINSTVRYK